MKREMIDKIRMKLAEKDMSNHDLAGEVGITDASMSRIMNGKQNPGPELVKKICYLLDIDGDSVNTQDVGKNKPISGRFAMLRLSNFPATWPPADDIIVMTTSVDPSEFNESGFFYIVRDGACSPVVQMSDRVFIVYTDNPPAEEANKLCAVTYQGKDMIRVIRIKDGDILLDPINKNGYKTTKVNREDLRISGVVDHVTKRMIPNVY